MEFWALWIKERGGMSVPVVAKKPAKKTPLTVGTMRGGMSEAVLRNLGLFSDFHQFPEGLRVGKGQVGQDLPVQLHRGQLQALDELAVGQAVFPGGGVDPRDPEAPEFPLAGLAVAESVVPRALGGLADGA